LGHLTNDLGLNEIIDIGEIVESGLGDLEEIASGLPDGNLIVDLIQTLLALLKKELGELEGSGSGSGLGSLELGSHGLGSHGLSENGNNGKRNHGRGNGKGQGNTGNDQGKDGKRTRGQQ
jgi:hypothetical protein